MKPNPIMKNLLEHEQRFYKWILEVQNEAKVIPDKRNNRKPSINNSKSIA